MERQGSGAGERRGGACGEKTYRWRLCDRQICIEESVVAARLGLTCPYQRLCPYHAQTRYEPVI